MIPKCITNCLQNSTFFCKFGRNRNKSTDKDVENNNKDENRNERKRITTKENTKVKYTSGKNEKEIEKIDKTNNNNNYNSIDNEGDENSVKIQLFDEQKMRKGGGRRRGSTTEGDDKFSVIKRAQKKNRVSMLKIFRNSLRNSVKEATIKEEEEEEGEEEGEGGKEGLEEKEHVKQDQPVNGKEREKLKTMDGAEFRQRGKEMVDYIVDYLDNVGSKRVSPEVTPGYLRPLLPDEAPQQPEPWDNIMQDVEKKIMPGVLHWNHPHFFAYFASGNSYPTILADMLSDALSMMGFSWASGPVCTELEIIMMDWYGKAIGLPKEFISTTAGSKGGGVIQGSASECILVTMLAARHHALEYLRQQEAEQKRQSQRTTKNSEEEEEEEEEEEDEIEAQSRLLHKLVVYCSREAHSCVEKAAKICLVKIRVLEPDEKGALRGETLRQAMDHDRAQGLTPFFVSCIIGSTASCTFDNLEEIGAVCREQENTPASYNHSQAARTQSWYQSQKINKCCNFCSKVDRINSSSHINGTKSQRTVPFSCKQSQVNGLESPKINGTNCQSQKTDSPSCNKITNKSCCNCNGWESQKFNGTNYQSQENLVNGINHQDQENLVNGINHQENLINGINHQENRVNGESVLSQKSGPPVWMHVDCAYAGSAFLCPELRPLMAGIEYADSVNTNPNKWMLTCFDCSCLWVKDKLRLTRGMVVDPIYLKHDYEDELIDFRHWQIPLSRRFRSLKLFFLFRSYGIAGLQRYIRNHIQLAKYFESLVGKDARFEVVNEVKMGLVCFRLKGPDLWTQELLAKINASGRIHMIPGVRNKRYFIRFAVTYEHAKEEHIRYAWKVIGHYTDTVLEKMTTPPVAATPLSTTPPRPRPRLSSRQHSFTRGVSRDVYKARSTSLYDGVSPIPVVDDDNDDNDNDDLNNNVFEEAFAAKSV